MEQLTRLKLTRKTLWQQVNFKISISKVTEFALYNDVRNKFSRRQDMIVSVICFYKDIFGAESNSVFNKGVS